MFRRSQRDRACHVATGRLRTEASSGGVTWSSQSSSNLPLRMVSKHGQRRGRGEIVSFRATNSQGSAQSEKPAVSDRPEPTHPINRTARPPVRPEMRAPPPLLPGRHAMRSTVFGHHWGPTVMSAFVRLALPLDAGYCIRKHACAPKAAGRESANARDRRMDQSQIEACFDLMSSNPHAPVAILSVLE